LAWQASRPKDFLPLLPGENRGEGDAIGPAPLAVDRQLPRAPHVVHVDVGRDGFYRGDVGAGQLKRPCAAQHMLLVPVERKWTRACETSAHGPPGRQRPTARPRESRCRPRGHCTVRAQTSSLDLTHDHLTVQSALGRFLADQVRAAFRQTTCIGCVRPSAIFLAALRVFCNAVSPMSRWVPNGGKVPLSVFSIIVL
jgi:hypothetical protein